MAKDLNDQNNQEEREKKILLWSGISFFMVMIFLLWGFNMRNVFGDIEREGVFSFASQAAGEDGGINKAWGEIKTRFKKLDELQKGNGLSEMKKGSIATSTSERDKKRLERSLDALEQELQEGRGQ